MSESEDSTKFIGKSIKGFVIGVPSNFYFEDIEEEVSEKISETLKVINKLGAKMTSLNINEIENMVEALQMVVQSEAYAIHRNNLDRYPGQWDDEVKEHIPSGLGIKRHEYANALKMREKEKQVFHSIYDMVDVIVTPTVGVLPPDIKISVVSNGKSTRWTLTKLTSPTNFT